MGERVDAGEELSFREGWRGETFMSEMDTAQENAKAILALAIQRERLERVMETIIDFTPAEEVWVRAFREAA
jgi:hypothetical protein